MGVADREVDLPPVAPRFPVAEQSRASENASVPRDLACGILLPDRLPISYLCWLRLRRSTSRFVDFLGALAGSYWYAVFQSPLRPTSRDNRYSTHGGVGCQRGFRNRPFRVMRGYVATLNGPSCQMDGFGLSNHRGERAECVA